MLVKTCTENIFFIRNKIGNLIKGIVYTIHIIDRLWDYENRNLIGEGRNQIWCSSGPWYF